MIIVFVESTADCFIRILYRINRENKSAAGVAFEATGQVSQALLPYAMFKYTLRKCIE